MIFGEAPVYERSGLQWEALSHQLDPSVQSRRNRPAEKETEFGEGGHVIRESREGLETVEMREQSPPRRQAPRHQTLVLHDVDCRRILLVEEVQKVTVS